MSRVFSGDKLISSVRNRAMVPDDTSTFTDQDILDIANEEIDVQLLDKLLVLHEEHLTVHVDIPRNEDGVYEIPYRAIGNKIKDVSLIKDNKAWDLTQISIGELPEYATDRGSYSGELDKFYIESNHIKILFPETSYDSIRIFYYIRPNVITKLDQAAEIAGISVGVSTVTLSFTKLPSKFSGSLTYDIVGIKTPNKIKVIDLEPTAIDTSLKTLTFALSDLQDYINEIKVGDYLCKAEESPFPNIPTEMHPLLAQLTAIHFLESTGDTEGLANAEKKLLKMQNAIEQLIDNRVELAPKKIKPTYGPLRSSIGSNGRRNGW